MDVTISKDGKQVIVLNKEFISHVFLLNGRVTPVDLFQLTKSNSRTAFNVPIVNGHPRRWYSEQELHRKAMVVKAMKMQLFPAFYSKLTPPTSLVGKCSVAKLGNSSLVYAQEVKLTDSNEFVCKNSTLTVQFDLNTRRPLPFEDGIVQKCKPFLTGQHHTTEFLRPLKQPPHPVYQHSLIASPTDMDANSHIGVACYIKYCFDCAEFGASINAYSVIKRGVLSHEMNDISGLFFAEGLQGDKLDVISWEDCHKPNILMFIIKKEDKDIFHCVFTFNIRNAKL
ncbi:uncharacterized protein LOC144447615 [Glandiceps talaboti]